jgi:mannose-1-phosphate guanylyltransferase
LWKNYGQVENINLICLLENLDKRDAFVIVDDIGWSDIGAWEALKNL